MGETDRARVFLSQERELIGEHFPHFATQAIHTGQDPVQGHGASHLSLDHLQAERAGKSVRNGRREAPVHCVMRVGNNCG